jgi:uncharacterized protein (DUF1800 family)
VTAFEGAIAANRFGFGARPGSLARIGDHPRDYLLQQLRGPAPVLRDALPASHDLLAKVLAERATRRDPAGAQPSAVQLAKTVRETYLPAYVAEVGARARAAITSQADFLERLVHFWSNHFAVSVDKIAVLGLAGAMEREAVRPNVLGNFADMLLAVEQHPAMLLYLDNHISIGPDSQAARVAGARGRQIGLNENLGREILELHTLGVEGGYTQADVQSLAAIITGWSVGGEAGRLRGGDPGRFFFRAAFHQPGAMQLMGRRYVEEGVEQGNRALRDLALDPRTAAHIAGKLARHFVADEPSPALVARLQKAYLDASGDLPALYAALVASPEVWQSPLAKFKTPTDYIYSTCRALDLPFGGRMADMRVFELLGQRSFQPGSPAGWPDRGADWDGSAALLKRLEWAQELGQRLGSARNAVQVADASLGGALSGATRTGIQRAQDGAQALTLLLAAPEFMRR